MKRNGDIVSYTAEEIDAMLARGEGRSNFAKEITEEELVASIIADPDEELDEWQDVADQSSVPHLVNTHLRLDLDIIEWFKSGEAGYETRINAVLRSFVDAQKKDANGK